MAHFDKKQEPLGRFIAGEARLWRMEEELSYYSDILKKRVLVRAGFVTDFASIPRVLWRILPPWDRHRRAAIIHDYLYRTQKFGDRETADKVFLEAMEVCGVPWWKRRTMYAGLRIGGWKAWNDHQDRIQAGQEARMMEEYQPSGEWKRIDE